MAGAQATDESWGLEAGDELVPGRTVVRDLGGGSAYEVLLVWDAERATLLVAKVLRPAGAQDPAELRALRKEWEALQALQHPVVVRGFEAVLDGPRPHVLIEHLEGPSLWSLLRRHGRLELAQVLPLALHVAGALHFLHRRGWVHLDVKPDNLIMGVPPRLIDLSIARTQERADRLRGPVGTDGYMAPEQCLAAEDRPGTVGPPADVWGLGATLHHALAGEKPWRRPREARDSPVAEERFPQLAGPAPALPREVPPALAELVRATLDPDPAARPTAHAVLEALEPLVEQASRRLVLARRGARFRQ